MQLELARKKIDQIDSQIVSLVSERLQLAKRIGSLKAGRAILVPGREQAILARLAGAHPEVPRKALEGVFHEIFAASRAVQMPRRIAGPGSSRRKVSRQAAGVKP